MTNSLYILHFSATYEELATMDATMLVKSAVLATGIWSPVKLQAWNRGLSTRTLSALISLNCPDLLRCRFLPPPSDQKLCVPTSALFLSCCLDFLSWPLTLYLVFAWRSLAVGCSSHHPALLICLWSTGLYLVIGLVLWPLLAHGCLPLGSSTTPASLWHEE